MVTQPRAGSTSSPKPVPETAGDPEFDVFIAGPVFLDIILAELAHRPAPGTEVMADGMASCPGGAANMAVAASRLGLRTSLASAFGDDAYGDFCRRTLSDQEGVDLSRSARFDGWHSPVTVSIAVDRDREMITHAHPPPVRPSEMIGDPPTARAMLVDLTDKLAAATAGGSWVEAGMARGSLVFADVAWDPDQEWPEAVLAQLDGCHAFMPNATEAMAYTRTDNVESALYALADRVPLAVITNGTGGALAIDATTGEEARVPAVFVDAVDPTGAGDVFAAALITGSLSGWPLSERLALSVLCASQAVRHFGGSLAAPGWGEITDWWQRLQRCDRNDAYHRGLRRRYAFLDQLTADIEPSHPRHATATIARAGH